IYEGERRFSAVVRFPESFRSSPETIGQILLKSPNGALVRLQDLAEIRLLDGPAQISREMGKRRLVIGANVNGRDLGGFVTELQSAVAKAVDLPEGMYLKWGGQYENLERATKRLSVIIPLTLLAVYFLLFMLFQSLRTAALIILMLPFASIGGILSLFLSGEYLSVPASVGFITLWGIAVLNGVVLITVLWLWVLLFTALPLRALEAADLQHPPIREWQQQLDDAEARLKSGDLHDEDAVALRDRLLLLDSRLREMGDAALERAALIGHDLDALGPAPKDGEAPEAPRLSSRRKALQDQMAAQDAGAKESDLLLSRLSRVLSEIKSLRRERLTQRILTRSFGTLDPLNWQRTVPEWQGFVGAVLKPLMNGLGGGAGLLMWQKLGGFLALLVVVLLRWRLG
ncbi:MAG: efflux RND transporter permease subunit, partial [Gammaproteobacteria bacterium]|nr:efflux RND transporter permease subunit [Gammaproteobacteria bacterium]